MAWFLPRNLLWRCWFLHQSNKILNSPFTYYLSGFFYIYTLIFLRFSTLVCKTGSIKHIYMVLFLKKNSMPRIWVLGKLQ